MTYFQLTCNFIYEICKVDTKYTYTKKSGSNMPYFDVKKFTFLCVFHIRHKICITEKHSDWSFPGETLHPGDAFGCTHNLRF